MQLLRSYGPSSGRAGGRAKSYIEDCRALTHALFVVYTRVRSERTRAEGGEDVYRTGAVTGVFGRRFWWCSHVVSNTVGQREPKDGHLPLPGHRTAVCVTSRARGGSVSGRFRKTTRRESRGVRSHMWPKATAQVLHADNFY